MTGTPAVSEAEHAEFADMPRYQLIAALREAREISDINRDAYIMTAKMAQVAEAKLAEIRAVVDEQAEDPALWHVLTDLPLSKPYLQAALRRLHKVIEE